MFDPCKRILERFGSNRQTAIEWIGFPSDWVPAASKAVEFRLQAGWRGFGCLGDEEAEAEAEEGVWWWWVLR